MIAVTYHDDLNEVQGDPALAALFARQTAPFDRLEWFTGMAEECAMTPLFAVARAEHAAAALALTAAGGHPRALTNWYTFRWRPLGDDLALLTALAVDLKKRAWRVTLAPLPAEDGSATLLATAFRAAGWRGALEQSDVNHVLLVAGRGYAEYLASRPGQLRTTLKRKAGKVRVALHDSFDVTAWADYEAVYAASWKPEEGSPAFLRRFAEAEGAAGRLRLAIAYSDGRPVAAQLWTVEGGTAWIHKLAHIEEAKSLSPGTTLTAALMERVIDRERVELVDFGTGDDAYKRDWMDAVRPRYRLDLFDPASPRAWPHLARAALRRLARGNARV